MKLRINREELGSSLRAVCVVAAARTTKPILQCVRLEVHADVLLLTATDSEMAVRCAVTQVEVDEPGETLVVADIFSKIVNECPDEVLRLELAKDVVHLHGKGSHFQMVTQNPTEFPPVPAMEGEPDFFVDHELLAQLVEWTAFAAARESTRYAMNGVLWEVHDGFLTLVATDGRRLALGRGKLEKVAEGKTVAPVIVPNKALSLFSRLPTNQVTQVGVKVMENLMLVSFGGALISTSLVEGHFPKYQDVIPADCDRVVGLVTQEFQSALRRAALLTNEESKGVRLSLSDGNLTLSSRAPEQGEATVSIPVKYRGEALEIGFNPVFLLDVLRVAHAEELTMAFKDANRPGVVRMGEDFLHVVMPVNLG